MREHSTRTATAGRLRLLLLSLTVAMAVVAATAATASAQWPTGCVELNDIVERHLGNAGSVGIYQRVFGEQAEGACQSDHREDVRAVFAWAFRESPAPASAVDGEAADIGGWPTTCVDLNDIVERHLGNDQNVGIYQRTFGEQAETACRQDHADAVRDVFGWATPCDAASLAAGTQVPSTATSDPTRATLHDLASEHSALQMVLVRLPWLACHVYPWLQDGVSGHDYQTLESLMTLAQLDASFAMEVASYPWFADGVDYDREAEWGVVRDLIKIARLYPELLAHVRELPWMNADHMHDPAWPIFLSLVRLASSSVELAITVVTSPWLRDGVNDQESFGLGSLNDLAKQDLDLARELLSYTLTPSVRTIDVLLLERIETIRLFDPNLFHLLVNQPWYQDGLDANERAFITGTPYFALERFFQNPDYRYFQSKTISLPLAGEVTVWAFDYRPLPPGEALVEMASEAARELERFMGTPFPTDSIIIRLTDNDHAAFGLPAWVLDNEIGINRHFYPRLDRHVLDHRRLVYHEMSHLYFNELGPYYSVKQLGPNWLDEGGANFMDAYIDARLGFQSLEERLHVVKISAREHCHDHGFENILKLTEPGHGDVDRWGLCRYILGEHLILNLYYIMGESALSAALREMYWTGHFIRPFPLRHSLAYPSDLQAYQTFLKHAPPDRKDAVREVYRRIHGGPYIPPDN